MKNEQFFDKFAGESLTYNDLILLPQYVDFPLSEVDMGAQITRGIRVKIPVVSSPMDTVTEADLAIAIALQGGLGVIHYNMTAEQQLDEIQKVKRYQNGFVSDPICLPPSATIREVLQIRREMGYSTIPITHNGESRGRLLGLITKYDYSTLDDDYLNKSVSERMIQVENLTAATYEELCTDGTFDLIRANERLLDSHSAALPIVDGEGNMCFLITRSDLDKHQNYPDASMDDAGCLLVGAAVETWAEKAQKRIEVIGGSVDVVCFDTSQGFSRYELDLVRWTKEHYPHLQIIAGNVVTAEACEALIAAGADALRIGMGSGSICTTQEVAGIGRGQATAIYECGKVGRKHGVPIIADGGIKGSSDIVKALTLGANAVMLGSLLACTSEAPGLTHIKDGVRLKEYRGMGSLKAMERGSAVRYGMQKSAIQVPEGVSGMVSSRGSVSEWVPCLLQGVKQGLHKLGYCSLEKVHRLLDENKLLLERRSEGAKREGSVHSLYEVVHDSIPTQETQKKKAIGNLPQTELVRT
ncbi:MAG: IMP dehydrogenase [Chlamydiales bacterium]|nr:IMP dehydrogenase [Chlamydiia bacterium]MCP5508493.1 IMP dehydrogenase [Chlamydiales bacterium]